MGYFEIGNWSGEKHCPGIPLDPEVLEERENVHVNWVELEFGGDKGKYCPATVSRVLFC